MTAQQEDTPLVPPEVESGDGWTLAHQNYGNTRTATNAIIDSSNVEALDIAWSFPITGNDAPNDLLASPLVSETTVYFQDGASNVYAIALADGATEWEQMYDTAVSGPNGPGIGYGHLYVTSGENSFSALDSTTGESVWTFETPNGNPIGGVQPYAFGGQIYITSQTGGEAGMSGYVYAVDATTGELAWEFQIVEEGFWGDADVNGGGDVAYSPAIDTNRDLLIWGTGSPAPSPGTADFPNGTSREEPTLYTNSVIALDPISGDLKWHNYANPDDLFNHDIQLPPVLASITVDGEDRDIVIGSGALGEIIAMDRISGEALWRTPVGERQNADITTVPEGITVNVYPGIMGGVSSPMAFSEGIVYASVVNLPTAYTDTSIEDTDFGTGTSELIALDATSGIVLWSQDLPAENYSGATVVNDLVFTATIDGMIYAFDALTGEEVWTYEASAGINGAPAVANDTILFPAGMGDNPALIALRVVPQEIVQVQGMAVPPPAEAETEAEGEEMADMDHGDMDDMPTPDPAVPTAVPQVLEGAMSDPTEYISLGEGEQTIDLNVISSVGGLNNGLNFNGYANGAVIVNVPEGWTVNVNFENRSNFPHSVAIVPVEMVNQRNVGDPAFEGAATGGAEAGIIGTSTFTFVASEIGNYAIACAVPSHSLRGQWWYFNVVSADQQPSVQIADLEPYVLGQ